MEVRRFHFKPQTSQRRELRLKRLYYVGSPPFFSSSSAWAFKDTSNILHEGCCDNVRPWMMSWPQKLSRMVLYMFCFYKYRAPLSRGFQFRPARQLRYYINAVRESWCDFVLVTYLFLTSQIYDVMTGSEGFRRLLVTRGKMKNTEKMSVIEKMGILTTADLNKKAGWGSR